MAWTKEQMQCIDPVNGIHNMLVSAGAGAGKTATLVEKIIQSIMNENHGTGINEILCVTFTRDAAREMKERIVFAIENMLRKLPNNTWLKKQLAFAETASIMTIDSFCLRLLKDHISNTDIDPAFRIADSAELSVLWELVMDNYLEEKYDESSAIFISYADSYATGKHDNGIRESISAVYSIAQANPFPYSWLTGCREKLVYDDVEKAEWLLFLVQDIYMQLASFEINLQHLLHTCNEEDGPRVYEPMIKNDIRQLQTLQRCTSYKTLSAELAGISFDKLAAVKDKKVDFNKKEYVKSVRTDAKKALQTMQKKYSMETRELDNCMEEIKPHLLLLLDLTLEFTKRYGQAKKEKAIMDFSDIEHAALSLLVDEETEAFTEIADTVASGFKQIYVDEYQDVNMLQESIIQSVSGERAGNPNVFMVGDVKQSIYKFRLARPELFMEKYSSYQENDMAPNQKVELQKNFRSRKEVLDTINFFFSQLMTPYLGNIQYDDKTALNHGAAFPPGVDAKKTSLILIDTNSIPDMEEEMSGRKIEAIRIAEMVNDIVGKEAVYDKRTETYRTATYKDIVVLTRTFTGWAEDLRNVLDTQGVPCYADKKEGFFDTVEVQAVLSILQAADNPMQDVMLSAAMMRVWNFSVDEMAELAITFKKVTENKGSLYSYVIYYKDYGTDLFLKEKVTAFLAFLKKINTECKDLSIYSLLNMIYEETGYYAKTSSLPTGEIKIANLEMLLMEAEKFATTTNSAGGIFQFVRYVNAVRKYETDASASSYQDKDAVRITTIHKSKGLEFPIVIVAGLGKLFNQNDTRKAILVHQEFGVVSDFMNPENKTRKLTLAKRAVARKMQIETLEEELRILYVAMTRAKERLILIGSNRHLSNKMEKYISLTSRTVLPLPYMELTQATSYLDWIIMALVRNKVYEPFMAVKGMDMNYSNPLYHTNCNLEIKQCSAADILLNYTQIRVEEKITKEMILQSLNSRKDLGSNQEYPHKEVAALKPKALPGDLDTGKKKNVCPIKEKREPVLPQFMRTDFNMTGADKGSIYHRLLQVIDFANCDSISGIENEVKKLLDNAVFSIVEIEAVNVKLIEKLFKTEIGKRMMLASQRNSLKREVYYMESVPAMLVNPNIKDGTSVIMQGVIDAYFEEDNEYILIDYKSEYMQPGKEAASAKKHSGQIERYRNVMIKNGKTVKEAYVLFLQTGKAIAV